MKKLFSLVLVGVALAFGSSVALAQPYYTNSTAANGAYQPNAAAVNAYPSWVAGQQQQNMGILTGSSISSTDGTVTNTFPTTYVYTYPPVVTVTQTGSICTTSNLLTSVTTTNFVYKCGAINITNNWISVGR